MITIHKYPLRTGAVNKIDLTGFFNVLHIGDQNGNLTMWVEEHIGQAKQIRHFQVYGTGHELTGQDHYCGTAQINGNVWHVYQKGNT